MDLLHVEHQVLGTQVLDPVGLLRPVRHRTEDVELRVQVLLDLRTRDRHPADADRLECDQRLSLMVMYA